MRSSKTNGPTRLRDYIRRLGGRPSGHGAGTSGNIDARASNDGHPCGLEVVHDGPDPVVDIVALHGLNGHRDATWTAGNGVHWLRDLLPQKIPQSRILCWGYDARTHSSSFIGCKYLFNHARELVSELYTFRDLSNTQERPIIFIVHSLGGVVLKSALIYADSTREGAMPEHRSVKLSTHGILFMGTPHQGVSGVSIGQLLVNISSVLVSTNADLLEKLERDSESLQEQLRNYGPISRDFVTKFFYEEFETPTLLGHKIMVVPQASAVVPGQVAAEAIGIRADHRNMVRFSSNEDHGYKRVSDVILQMLKSSREATNKRWEIENRMLKAVSEPVITVSRLHQDLATVSAQEKAAQFNLSPSLSDVSPVNQFVAREAELSRMHEILSVPDDRGTLVLSGLGGMGKTQLALAYIKQHRCYYSAIIWMNATDKTSLEQSFMKAAERIRRQHPSVSYLTTAIESKDPDTIVSAVKRWLDEPYNSHWLLVYDNHDHPKVGNDTAKGSTEEGNQQEAPDDDHLAEQLDSLVVERFDITPFLPETLQGAVIVTTRDSRLDLGRHLRLGKLERLEESIRILEAASNQKNLAADEGAKALAERLDGLPIALSTAGAYCHEGRSTATWSEYLEMYDASWADLVRSSPNIRGYDRTMYTTWLVSYKSIKEKNHGAAKLLKLWAHLDNGDLWYELLRPDLAQHQKDPLGPRADLPPWLRALTDRKLEFENAMHLLCDSGLATVNLASLLAPGQSRGYSVHGCVHSWSAYVLNDPNDLEVKLLSQPLVAACLPHILDPEFVLLTRRLWPHIDRCWKVHRYHVPLQPHHLQAVDHMADFFSSPDIAMYGRCKTLLKDMLRVDGLPLNFYLDILLDLSAVYRCRGRPDKAITVLRRALQDAEEINSPSHGLECSLACSLSHTFTEEHRFEDAEATLVRARERHRPTNSMDTLDDSTSEILHAFVYLYKAQGRLEEAETMLHAALSSCEPTVRPTNKQVQNLSWELGEIYYTQGRLKDAEAIFKPALEVSRALNGPFALDVETKTLALASLYLKQNRYGEAQPLTEELRLALGKTFGPGDPNTLGMAHILIQFYLAMDQLGKGCELLKQILEGPERVYGQKLSARLHLFAECAAKNLAAGRLDEAKKAIIQADCEIERLVESGLFGVFGQMKR